VKDILLGARAMNRGYFRGPEVARLVAEHQQRGCDRHEILWRLIVLEEWHRCFVDRVGFAPVSRGLVERKNDAFN
jgi:hypothetical protein